MKMNSALTLATITVVALVALAAVGCAKKAGPPPGAPQITTPPPGPGAAKAGPAAPAAKPKSEKPAEKPKEGTKQQEEPAEPAETGGAKGDKPAKAKLSDDQFAELMGDMAVTIKKIGDKKMSPFEAKAELEKVAKKYGLTLDEVHAEEEAHKVGTAEERAALEQKVFEKIQQRIQEEEKKSGQ